MCIESLAECFKNRAAKAEWSWSQLSWLQLPNCVRGSSVLNLSALQCALETHFWKFILEHPPPVLPVIR